MQNKIAIIGDEDLISGFLIFGFDTFFVREDRIKELFKEVLAKDYLVYFVQERYYLKIKDILLEIEDKPFPIVYPIPDHTQIKDLAKEELRQITLRAIGADILK